ncbi:MAG: hypothetical protein WAK82_00705 [Streptosporangiaceae bacterium]
MPTFAGRSEVGVDELVDAGWIATPSSSAEPLFLPPGATLLRVDGAPP